MEQQEVVQPGRKIELDTRIYCPHDFYIEREDKTCDHDYPEEPGYSMETCASWKCTRCGCLITFYVWQ